MYEVWPRNHGNDNRMTKCCLKKEFSRLMVQLCNLFVPISENIRWRAMIEDCCASVECLQIKISSVQVLLMTTGSSLIPRMKMIFTSVRPNTQKDTWILLACNMLFSAKQWNSTHYDGLQWTVVDCNGQGWTSVDYNKFRWTLMDFDGLRWYGLWLTLMIFYRIQMTSMDFIGL